MAKRKIKKKKGFFKENWNSSLKYLKACKKFIFAAALIFIFFVLAGYFIPVPDFISQKILELVNELLKQTEGMSWSQLTTFIFFNNLKSSFFGMFLGIILGIFSFLTLATNGYILGFVSTRVVSSEGFTILWKLLPHGIFELPALLISMGLGMKMGTFVFKKKKKKSLKDFFVNSIKVFLFIVIPLLFIAALIEGAFIFLF